MQSAFATALTTTHALMFANVHICGAIETVETAERTQKKEHAHNTTATATIRPMEINFESGAQIVFHYDFRVIWMGQ